MARRDRGGDRGREARRAARPLDPGAGAGRRRGAGARRADRRRAKRPPDRRRRCRPDDSALAVPGAYLRRNFAVAAAAAEAVLGRLDPDRVARPSPRGSSCRGGWRCSTGDPPLILDAAHNPDGARALAEALPEAAGEAPVVACLAVLADKDAAGVLAALAPRLDARRLHRAPGRAARREPGVPAPARWRQRDSRSWPRRPGWRDGGGRPAGGRAAARRGGGARARRRDARHRFALPSWVRRGRERSSWTVRTTAIAR